MRVGNFAVTINPGHEETDGYVSMSHNTQYSIGLHNYWHDRRVDAEVTVDGKHVGTFRLERNGWLNLERPTSDTGKFTFYRAGTKKAKKAQLDMVRPDNLGLVSVTFKPEYPREVPTSGGVVKPMSGGMGFCPTENSATRYGMRSSGGPSGQSCTRSAGGTGLSGHSDQSFYTVSSLNYDMSSTVVVNLRLVSRKKSRTKPRSNPIPLPVS